MKKEIYDLNSKINDLNYKNEEYIKENNSLTSRNKELYEKLKENKNDEIIIKERDKYKLSYDNLNIKYNESVSKFQSEIKTMKEMFINNNNNNINNTAIQINDLNYQIKKIKEEKNILLSQLNEILLENQELSKEYQNNLAKLKQTYILNSEIDSKYINDINYEGITNPKSLNDFINKCTDEIIKLNNENYNIKNKYNTLNLQIELNNKENNDNKIINDRLKKAIENYSHELDNKNIILNQINIEKNQIENYIKKIENDRQYILTVLLRICKIFSNSNIYNLINEMMNYKNLNINQKEKINLQVLNEIKRCESQYKELKENESRCNYIKTNINNIDNNNITFKREESIDYKSNINKPIDKIYNNKILYNNEFNIEEIYKYK